jgi:hypothetical protein
VRSGISELEATGEKKVRIGKNGGRSGGVVRDDAAAAMQHARRTSRPGRWLQSRRTAAQPKATS